MGLRRPRQPEDPSSIERLHTAAASVPVDVDMARAALAEVAGELKKAENMCELTSSAATALAKLVASLTLENPGSKDLPEFNTHAATYDAIASALSDEAPEQTTPTQTAGKNQSGGKS